MGRLGHDFFSHLEGSGIRTAGSFAGFDMSGTVQADRILSLVALMFLSLGLQLFFLGMFGLYLGKVFMEVKSRPRYFVRRFVGFDKESR